MLAAKPHLFVYKIGRHSEHSGVESGKVEFVVLGTTSAFGIALKSFDLCTDVVQQRLEDF